MSSPSVHGGVVYVGSGYAGPLFALEAASGKERWRFPIKNLVCGTLTVHEDPGIAGGVNPIEEGHVDVELRLRAGGALTRRVSHPRGSAADPLRAEDLAAKFLDCADAALEPEDAEAALGRLLRIDREPDVRGLVAALTPGVTVR